MQKLTFKNIVEIRMGSPFNIAEVVLFGGFVPDLSGYTFQDIGLVDQADSVVYLVQWEIENNEPGFKIWQISSNEKSICKTNRFEGCCKEMGLVDNKLSLKVFRNGKAETIIVDPSEFTPFNSN